MKRMKGGGGTSADVDFKGAGICVGWGEMGKKCT